MTEHVRPAPDPSPASLTVAGLHKAFGPHAVLAGVTFTAAPGTVTVIGGTNGTGKSTLLRCLAGTARFAGDVHLGDAPITRDAPTSLRRRISYLPQTPGFPEQGTVGEVLDLFARLRGADPAAVPLPPEFLPDPHQRLRTLSGGQQQRVALTVALLGMPSLLLLDEPVANLDRAGRAHVWEAIRSVAGDGGIVLIASPNPAELEPITDRILELDDGRVVLDRLVDHPAVLHEAPDPLPVGDKEVSVA